jgi:hypothetical protein
LRYAQLETIQVSLPGWFFYTFFNKKTTIKCVFNATLLFIVNTLSLYGVLKQTIHIATPIVVGRSKKSKMNKLLKDAIADAKAVRETALANAKMALEEAFAPKLQSMLSHKIKEEMEEEDEMVEMEDEDEMTMEMDHEDDMTTEGEGGEPEMEDEVESEEDMEVSDEDPEEEMSDEELEEILRELEGEENEMADEEDAMNEEEDMEAEEEEVDLEEIIRALREEEGEEEEMEEEEGMDMEAEAELEEAYEVIKFLRSKLNEVNLLNAKLLYVNKLFKRAELSEAKKVKIIETFDRVTNVREAKLVYATLAESMTPNAPIAKSKKVVKHTKRGLTEGIASAPSKATRKPIIENTVYNRFNELINYNK